MNWENWASLSREWLGLKRKQVINTIASQSIPSYTYLRKLFPKTNSNFTAKFITDIRNALLRGKINRVVTRAELLSYINSPVSIERKEELLRNYFIARDEWDNFLEDKEVAAFIEELWSIYPVIQKVYERCKSMI